MSVPRSSAVPYSLYLSLTTSETVHPHSLTRIGRVRLFTEEEIPRPTHFPIIFPVSEKRVQESSPFCKDKILGSVLGSLSLAKRETYDTEFRVDPVTGISDMYLVDLINRLL